MCPIHGQNPCTILTIDLFMMNVCAAIEMNVCAGAIEKMSQNLVQNEHQLKELQTTEKEQQQREQVRPSQPGMTVCTCLHQQLNVAFSPWFSLVTQFLCFVAFAELPCCSSHSDSLPDSLPASLSHCSLSAGACGGTGAEGRRGCGTSSGKGNT